MADFDTNDVIRIGAVQKFGNAGAIVNVWHVQMTAGGPLAFAAMSQDIAEYMDALYAYITAYTKTTQVADHISIKNETQSTVWGNIAWGTYTGGTDAGDATALQVALLAFARTSLSRVQIRKYLGVSTETQSGGGVWLASYRGAAENMMAYHIVGQTMTNGAVLRGCAYRPLDGRVTFALSASTSEIPVIQRRRRSGRGG